MRVGSNVAPEMLKKSATTPSSGSTLKRSIVPSEARRRTGRRLGLFITSRLAHSYSDRLIGIHLNMMPLRRDPKMVANPTSEEQKCLERLSDWLKEETGYQWIPTTASNAARRAPAKRTPSAGTIGCQPTNSVCLRVDRTICSSR